MGVSESLSFVRTLAAPLASAVAVPPLATLTRSSTATGSAALVASKTRMFTASDRLERSSIPAPPTPLNVMPVSVKTAVSLCPSLSAAAVTAMVPTPWLPEIGMSMVPDAPRGWPPDAAVTPSPGLWPLTPHVYAARAVVTPSCTLFTVRVMVAWSSASLPSVMSVSPPCSEVAARL